MIIFGEFILDLLFAIASIFILSNLFYIVLIFASKKMMERQKLNWEFNSFETEPISLIVPAYNEEKNIVESVYSFLNQKYYDYEIIIVNDGSKDKTLDKLLEAFPFKEISFNESIVKLGKTKIKKVYYYESKKITLIDKENGGKADALNIGIDFSKYNYVCTVDADSLLDPKAFNRVMLEFSIDKDLVACGATIRVVNGITTKQGRIEKIDLPNKYIELCQLIEYSQSFLTGRLGWQFFEATMIISGAFGIYKKDALKQINGYDKNSIGEDMDLIVRLHKFLSKKNIPYRIGFIPDPLCWTEVPSDLKTLSNQRNRWQRGLLSSIFNGERVFFNTKLSIFSRFSIPYYILTEVFSPIIEILSYILTAISLIFGFLNYKIVILFIIISVLFSVILNLISVIYEESNFSKKITINDAFKLLLISFLINFGYRQFVSIQRIKGLIDFYSNKKDWGKMDRTGFLHKK